MTEYVKIHGDNWKKTDIKESVEWAREHQWIKQKWVARAALMSKGSASDYVGQKYNPEQTEFVEDGWNHDHCEICWWSLHEDDDPEHGEGYTTNGYQWLCTECFNQFLATKS